METQDPNKEILADSGASAPVLSAPNDLTVIEEMAEPASATPAAPVPPAATPPDAEEISLDDVVIALKKRDSEPNAEVDVHPLQEKAPKDLDGKLPLIPVPGETLAKIQEIIDQIPQLDVSKNPDAMRWLRIIDLSLNHLYEEDALGDAAARKDSVWKQFIEHEGNRLSMGTIKVTAKEGEKLTGDAAIMQMRALMGGGTPRQVMLPHSGFWVSVRAPNDSAHIDLLRRLAEDKVQLGRETTGVAFSNINSFFAGQVSEFVFSMVYNTTLRNGTENLGDKMLITDLPSFVLGGVAAIWPNGYNYTRAVLNGAGSNTKSRQGIVSVPKMQFYDQRAFTPWQAAHLAQRYGKNVTDEDLERYRKEFIRGQPRMVALNDSVSIELRVPTVNQYLNSGQRWINGIVNMVDKAFALPPTEDARNDFINQHGKATDMRQYGHWIKTIHMNGAVYDEVEAIDSLLDDMSSMDEVADKYMTEVKRYINDSTVAIVGVPVESGDVVEEGMINPRFAHILPIDVFHTFFTLLVQKVERINQRN